MEYLSLQQTAQKILRLSQHMLASARQHDWQHMAVLEMERRQSITGLFQHPDMPVCISQVARVIEEVLRIDKQSLQLGEAEKQHIQAQMHKQQQGQRVLSGYLSSPD